MTQFTNGADVLNALTTEVASESNGSAKMSSLSNGKVYTVKVFDASAVSRTYAYGIYNVVDSFLPENPPIIKDTGKSVFVNGNHTPWDKAHDYWKAKSEKFGDDASTEAYKYKIKPRFVFAFYDLTSGGFIYVDLSNKQAREQLAPTIMDYKDDLGELVFELKKSKSGTVSLTPVINPQKKLTPEQLENLAKDVPEFDASIFERLWFKKTEQEMLNALTQAGFDIALIGASKTEVNGNNEAAGDDIAEEDLPF